MNFFFLAAFILIYCMIHCYLYFSLTHAFDFSWRQKRFFRLVLILLALPFLIDRLLGGFFFFYPVSSFGIYWFGFIFISVFIFILKDLVSFFVKQKRKLTHIALALSFLFSAIGFYGAFKPVPVRTVEVASPLIPERLNGLKIIQLSDLHIDKLKKPESYEELIHRVNALVPDLIVITGDFNDLRSRAQLEKYVPVFSQFKATYGVFAVPGNHEYYNNINLFADFCHKAGIILLRNQGLRLSNGSFYIAGVDDSAGWNHKTGKLYLEKTLNGIDRSKPLILLSHRPYFFDEASEKGFTVQLSGHSHNGQLPPVVFIARLIYQYVSGLYSKNGSFLYVSSGTGYVGPPVRLLTNSEITEVILKTRRE